MLRTYYSDLPVLFAFKEYELTRQLSRGAPQIDNLHIIADLAIVRYYRQCYIEGEELEP